MAKLATSTQVSPNVHTKLPSAWYP